MKLLFTGRGGAGSWMVRGEQLGAAMGATVKPMATVADMKGHDLVVVVKRVPEALLEALKRSRVPWVYDIVDAYPQPGCSLWTPEQCKGWLFHHLDALRPPLGVIWPNRKMQEDADVSRGAVVYHHHRPGIKRNKISERISRVGYEGSAKYLDGWTTSLALECKRRNIEFVLNPAHIADLDIVIAMRGGAWDGYAQRNWKSNVKLANAHGSGTPFIGARESGYQETSTGCEYWADTPRELATALDWLESRDSRLTVHERFLSKPYTVNHAAGDMLCALKSL